MRQVKWSSQLTYQKSQLWSSNTKKTHHPTHQKKQILPRRGDAHDVQVFEVHLHGTRLGISLQGLGRVFVACLQELLLLLFQLFPRHNLLRLGKVPKLTHDLDWWTVYFLLDDVGWLLWGFGDDWLMDGLIWCMICPKKLAYVLMVSWRSHWIVGGKHETHQAAKWQLLQNFNPIFVGRVSSVRFSTSNVQSLHLQNRAAKRSWRPIVFVPIPQPWRPQPKALFSLRLLGRCRLSLVGIPIFRLRLSPLLGPRKKTMQLDRKKGPN